MKIAVFDKDTQQIIGEADRENVYKEGLYHGLVRILLFNSKGEILLQWRSKDEDTFPERWDQSAGGHVDAGEKFITSAFRELEEELGVKNVNLEEIGRYITEGKYNEKIINRINVVFKCTYDGGFNLQLEEVQKVKFFGKDELLEEIRDDPNKFTPGLIEIYKKFINK